MYRVFQVWNLIQITQNYLKTMLRHLETGQHLVSHSFTTAAMFLALVHCFSWFRRFWAISALYFGLGPHAPLHLSTPAVTVGGRHGSQIAVGFRDPLPHSCLRLVPVRVSETEPVLSHWCEIVLLLPNVLAKLWK